MKNFWLYGLLVWSLGLHAYAEKRIIVIIPSYNNEKYVEKNLNSVYDQEYDNYCVVYIDDCSTDKTLERVRDIVTRRGQGHRTTIIHNDHNCGAMANFYHAIHTLFDAQSFIDLNLSSAKNISLSGYLCNDTDIIVQLDGDDALKHTKVLARVNQEYSEHDVWLTNGRYVHSPEGKDDDQRRYSLGIIQRCAYREVEKVPSHLRTCYAGLFKRIRLQDFLYQGDFLRMTCDFAILFPLLEMAGNHIGFIDEILYEYNCINPINDFKKNVILQLHLNHVLRSREKYKPLTTFDLAQPELEPAVFIIAADQEQAGLCKKALESTVQGISCIQSISPAIEAKKLIELLDATKADYVFMVDAKMVCTHDFIITPFTRLLAQTKAHVCCLDRGVKTANGCVSTFVTIDEQVSGWQFAVGEYSWRQPFGAHAHIYAKKTLKDALSGLKSEQIKTTVFDALNGRIFDMESVGFCPQEPLFQECV